MGWFFGFKLHLLINHKGQIVAFKITDGSRDDRQPLEAMSVALRGKVFADKGYLSKSLLLRLWQRGLHLVTGIRRTMKNYLLPLLDKVLLRKRFIIETLFDKLKSHMGLEHSRHRSPINTLVHIISCLAATTLAQPKGNMGESSLLTLWRPSHAPPDLIHNWGSHRKDVLASHCSINFSSSPPATFYPVLLAGHYPGHLSILTDGRFSIP